MALKQARGELIAFLDCDDIWMPTKLEKQVAVFQSDPSIGIVISDTIFFNAKGDQKRLFHRKKPPQGNVFENLLTGYFISMETAVIRKAALDGLDEWFDTRFHMIEEADLFIRIAFRWRMGYVDTPLAKWRMHPESWTFTRRDTLPLEYEQMLAKLMDVIPNFTLDYPEAIRAVKRYIDKEYAICHWDKGESALARRRLRPHVTSGVQYLLFYIMTFMPRFVANRILLLKGIRAV